MHQHLSSAVHKRNIKVTVRNLEYFMFESVIGQKSKKYKSPLKELKRNVSYDK